MYPHLRDEAAQKVGRAAAEVAHGRRELGPELQQEVDAVGRGAVQLERRGRELGEQIHPLLVLRHAHECVDRTVVLYRYQQPAEVVERFHVVQDAYLCFFGGFGCFNGIYRF